MTRKSDTSFFVHKKVFKARSACIIKQSGSEHDYSEHLDIRYIVFPCSRFQKKIDPRNTCMRGTVPPQTYIFHRSI